VEKKREIKISTEWAKSEVTFTGESKQQPSSFKKKKMLVKREAGHNPDVKLTT
jgi:hypothetical protein